MWWVIIPVRRPVYRRVSNTSHAIFISFLTSFGFLIVFMSSTTMPCSFRQRLRASKSTHFFSTDMSGYGSRWDSIHTKGNILASPWHIRFCVTMSVQWRRWSQKTSPWGLVFLFFCLCCCWYCCCCGRDWWWWWSSVFSHRPRSNPWTPPCGSHWSSVARGDVKSAHIRVVTETEMFVGELGRYRRVFAHRHHLLPGQHEFPLQFKIAPQFVCRGAGLEPS